MEINRLANLGRLSLRTLPHICERCASVSPVKGGKTRIECVMLEEEKLKILFLAVEFISTAETVTHFPCQSAAFCDLNCIGFSQTQTHSCRGFSQCFADGKISGF